jgi:hypothetical protein
MKNINEKQEGDSGYVAGFNREQVGIYAVSLYAAKTKANEYFKPSKKRAGEVWVVLAETNDGTEVVHTP